MTRLDIGFLPPPARMTRRKLFKLGMAMSAGGFAGCAPQTEEQKALAAVRGIAPWPDDLPVPVVTHPGYGTYPDYDAIGPTGPWPKILSDRHKRQLERFADFILPATDTAPAPSEIGIAEFFDDWTSAPYPYMTDTRRVVHQGFAWLDRQMRMDHGADWLNAGDRQARRQLDRMRDAAGSDGPLAQAGGMYTHLRKLVIGAYYTTPEGEADLGHITPEVTGEDYAGPTGEALDHVRGLIAELGLDFDNLPVGPPPYSNAAYTFTGDEPA